MEFDDELVQRAIRECEESQTNEIANSCFAGLILSQLKQVSLGQELESTKREIIKVLLASTWTQRLYFIVRSMLMSLIGGVLTLAIIWYLGSIDVIEGFLIGTFIFIASLMISRLFDPAIFKAINKMVRYLSRHDRLRHIIVTNF
jgi:hypothetical protein